MPIHSRITSINSFATAKTDRVPIVSEYIEDYFNVKTNRPSDNTVPNKIETKGIDWTKAADGGTGEAEGLMWLKKLYETDDHSLWPKVNTDMVIDGRPVGVGSAYLVSNDNYKLQDGTANMAGTSGAGIVFEKDGFTIHRSSVINNVYTTGSTMDPMVYYSFKKKKKFFDIKVYQGNGVADREIYHDLDCVPGSVWIKGIDAAEEWVVYHKYGKNGGTPGNEKKYYYRLNQDDGATFYGSGSDYMIEVVGTTHVKLGGPSAYNNSGSVKYMIMFFADAGSGGFGDDGTLDGIACGEGKCGAWNSTDAYQDLGFEPQWILVKNKDSNSNNQWRIVDSKRIMYSNYQEASGTTYWSRSSVVRPNNNAQQAYGMSTFTDGSGFYIRKDEGSYGTIMDGSEETPYIYIAIASPQRTATQQNMALYGGVGAGGTNFYTATTVTAGESRPTVLTDFTPDTTWVKPNWNSAPDNWLFFTRKLGAKENPGMNNSKQMRLIFNHDTNKDGGNDCAVFYDNGFYANSDGTYSWDADDIFYLFKKARHFYDTQHTFLEGQNPLTVNHALGKKPELMISKTTFPGSQPSIGANWWMYSSAPGLGYTMTTEMNGNDAFSSGNVWGAEPTSSTFTLGSISGSVSGTGWAHTLLFASCPGVSKVGFYTGTGASLEVDCDFVNPPRFIMIQRTDQGGDRPLLWDSYRGLSGYNGAGEKVWSSPGDYTWTAPSGVTSISVVLVGGGGGTANSSSQSGGGGGGLAWKNNITVVPGTSYNLTVGVGGSYGEGSGIGSYYNGTDGGNSTLTVGSETYVAYGGKGGIYRSNGGSSYPSSPGDGGSRSPNTDGGGDGGRGGWGGGSNAGGGGGGAGGYTGDGGGGGYQGTSNGNGTQGGAAGVGGGSGGGSAGQGGNSIGGGGGGTGLYGEGASGGAASGGSNPGTGGNGGSVSNQTTPPGPNNNVGGGRNGPSGWSNGAASDAYFGGGGAAQGGGGDGMKGAKGGIRIVWGESKTGIARTFPESSDAPYNIDPYLNLGVNNQSVSNYSRDVGITDTGFEIPASASFVNAVGGKYIFLAIA